MKVYKHISWIDIPIFNYVFYLSKKLGDPVSLNLAYRKHNSRRINEQPGKRIDRNRGEAEKTTKNRGIDTIEDIAAASTTNRAEGFGAAEL